MYFPDKGRVRTLRTLYVYATVNTHEQYGQYTARRCNCDINKLC